jgi:NDP-sugar pyrophosphorylase family protein
MKPVLVYAVAGMSSRFNGKIKTLANVGPNNEPLIECSIKQAIPTGFSKIIFIVSEKTEKAFKDFFKNSYKGIPIEYAKQTFNPEERDSPWGTTDAICCASHLINSNFIFCNGDDIYGEEAFNTLAIHLDKNPEQDAAPGYILSNTFKETKKGNRAVFYIDEDKNIKKIVEIADIEKHKYHEKNLSSDNLCSMNIWALTPKTLSLLNQQLQKFREKNKGNRTAECKIATELSNIIEQNRINMKIYPTNTATIGITYPEDIEIVRKKLQENAK